MLPPGRTLRNQTCLGGFYVRSGIANPYLCRKRCKLYAPVTDQLSAVCSNTTIDIDQTACDMADDRGCQEYRQRRNFLRFLVASVRSAGGKLLHRILSLNAIAKGLRNENMSVVKIY